MLLFIMDVSMRTCINVIYERPLHLETLSTLMVRILLFTFIYCKRILLQLQANFHLEGHWATVFCLTLSAYHFLHLNHYICFP